MKNIASLDWKNLHFRSRTDKKMVDVKKNLIYLEISAKLSTYHSCKSKNLDKKTITSLQFLKFFTFAEVFFYKKLESLWYGFLKKPKIRKK